MKEACEALGVSRQMVQKLEAASELKATRENARVFFDVAEVEALRTGPRGRERPAAPGTRGNANFKGRFRGQSA